MPEQTTANATQTTTDQWDRRPVITLVAVIVA